ncbi:MAG: class I SAM-dependent methyltransferase [Thermoleophilaceae bacterium]|jgi:ubiquinone/menaquinone biosynthesis C-methylase UbiE
MGLAGAEEIKDVNERYHDVAAPEYDTKWSVAYDAASQARVVAKLGRALGGASGRFAHGLEIGAGTGYFSLNLLAAGVLERAVATDISRGMLERLERSADDLGLSVETREAEAAELPFADASFDLVLGHAVLHHLPDLDAAFAEFRRVLRPGGTLAFCGEPSRHGDRLAAVPKRAAVAAAPAWRRLMRASAANGSAQPGEHQLEWLVDVHSFTPGGLARLARRAGLERVRVRGEELAASWFGWASRTLEASAEPAEVPALWRWCAYGGYQALRAVDRALLEPYLPPALFYNLLLSARAPAEAV